MELSHTHRAHLNSQQVMSPETCQKRNSIQQFHQGNNLRLCISSRDRQISNQKPRNGVAPVDAPINVPSDRTFNNQRPVTQKPLSHSETSSPYEISKAAQRKSRVLHSTVMRTSVIITQAANGATLRQRPPIKGNNEIAQNRTTLA